MIYERQLVRWLVATIFLIVSLTGVAFCAVRGWQESGWSWFFLGALFASGSYPFIREIWLLGKSTPIT